MGRSKWTAWVQPAVDVHYRQHWIRRIGAKLAVPLAEAAAPDTLVGRVLGVHKPTAAFGRGGGGVLVGLVTGYNAGRLTWSAKYDDERDEPQAPEELGAADMGLYGPDILTQAMRGRRGRPTAGCWPRGVGPRRCLVTICHISPKGHSLLLRKYQRGTIYIWHAGCNRPFFLVFLPGVVGRDTGSTTAALLPVIYNASSRAVAIDSM
jgi:hypothetical protein